MELGINPARIGVLGASAGGHLAACAGTLFDAPEGRTGAELGLFATQQNVGDIVARLKSQRDRSRSIFEVIDEVRVKVATAVPRLHIDFVQILKGQGFTLSEIGTHAGLNDTSLMLALDPSLVREDRLSDGSKFGSADGVYGDPSKASARLGILGVDAIVFQTVAAIKSAVSRR